MKTIADYYNLFSLKSSSGIKLIVNDRIARFDDGKVMLSCGTVNGQQIDPINYPEVSFVPKQPWRVPQKEEVKYLFASNLDTSSYVAIVKFEQQLCDDLKEGYYRATENKAYYKDYELLAQKILDSAFFNANFSFYGEVKLLGVVRKPPNLLTVTTDQNKLIGMHLDSWDNLPLKERPNSSNRISINLSSETRYLLFINLTLWEMASILHLENDVIPDEVCNEFMKRFPEYPVIRLSMEPYEAYIAPTEYMIHDGSTIGMTTNSLLYVYRGNFSIKSNRHIHSKTTDSSLA